MLTGTKGTSLSGTEKGGGAMKRLIVVLIVAMLFIGNRFHLRTMHVIYYYSATETATLIDCDGELFAIFADDIEAGDRLICLVYGNGKDAVIMDYVEVLRVEEKACPSLSL